MQNMIKAQVIGIRIEASGVRSLELQALAGELPEPSAGAHIDLQLPGGLIRQYSLLGGSSTRRYRVGVGLSVPSRGGSEWIHKELRVGDELSISAPRNHFALSADEHHSVLIAGGIGITPLHFMAHELSAAGKSWSLYYCVREHQRAAFVGELKALQDQYAELAAVHVIVDQGQADQQLDLAAVVAQAPAGSHFYCCGPTPFLQAFEKAVASVDASRVHTEYFAAPASLNTASSSEDKAFTVLLQRSQKSIVVPSGQSILEVLGQHGVAVYSSCREGVCGSCETRVLEGDIDHRDAVLSPAEKAANNTIMLCVSRASGDKLVLDL